MKNLIERARRVKPAVVALSLCASAAWGGTGVHAQLEESVPGPVRIDVSPGSETSLAHSDAELPVPTALLARVRVEVGDSEGCSDVVQRLFVRDGAPSRPVSVRSALLFKPLNPQLAARLGLDRWIRIECADAVLRESTHAFLGSMPEIDLVEIDSIGQSHGVCLPADPLLTQQWWALNTGQNVQGSIGTPGADSRAAEAWCLSAGSPQVIVAILDTGVSLSHPDLQGNLLPGFNFFNNNTNTDDNQNLSHGTFCAGIAVGRAFNGVGIAGIAPACKLLPVKVLSGSFGSETSTANGLIYAADQGARVVNMSLGFPQGSIFFRDAVLYAKGLDVVMIASTGNSPTSTVGYPAKWSSVIAVGATDNRDLAASFQTTGAEMDLCAPGVNILTTTDTFTIPNGYSLQSGTSMAAPIVAGAAALMRSVRPSLTADQVKQILFTTARDLGVPGLDPIYGWGRIDSAKAVSGAVVFGLDQRGDFDGNGVVDLIDLLQVITIWLNGAFDYNQDGTNDLVDMLEFVTVWSNSLG